MKSFEEVYKEIYTSEHKALEKLRKKAIRRNIKTYVWLTIILTAISLVLFYTFEPDTKEDGINGVMIWLYIVIIITMVIVKGLKKNQYTKIFKQEVIDKFVKTIDKNLEYHPEVGLPQKLYKQGEFENFDRYYSEDTIIGSFNGKVIKMAEVLTMLENRGSDVKTIAPVFEGIFGTVECPKNIGTTIKIKSDRGILGAISKGKNSVEMDSTEFEKHFDINSENKIIAMQILTSDVMALMIEFRKQSNLKYDITINQNQIYIRFHTGKVFEPNMLKNSLDYNTLKRYYEIIEFIFRITESINNVIEKSDI